MSKNKSAIQKAFNKSIRNRVPNIIHIDNAISSNEDKTVVAIGKLQNNGYIVENVSPYNPSNKSNIERELRKLQQLNNATV